MQATSALSRSLAKSIHPQLPLNPRESSQLLRILTTSFNQQLNRHHPVSASSPSINSNVSSSHSAPNSAPSSEQRGSNLRHLSAAVSANDHISTLLSSPLLTSKPRASSFSKSKPAVLLPQFRLDQQLVWLQDRIASATVTLDDFVLCLGNVRRQLAKNSDSIVKSIKDSSAGSTIVTWLNTSGRVSENQLLCKENGFMNTLIEMLIIEERRDIIWSWLKPTSSISRPRHPKIFHGLLLAELQFGSGMESAMLAYLAARGQGYQGFRPTDAIARYCLSDAPWTVQPEILQRFLSDLGSQAGSPSFSYAVMSLYRPQNPSTKEGVAYVRNISNKLVATGTLNMTDQFRRRHVAFSLSLARSLLAQLEVENANFVLRFTQEHFEKEIGIQRKHLELEMEISPATSTPAAVRTGPSEDEVANMQQLEGLLAT